MKYWVWWNTDTFPAAALGVSMAYTYNSFRPAPVEYPSYAHDPNGMGEARFVVYLDVVVRYYGYGWWSRRFYGDIGITQFVRAGEIDCVLPTIFTLVLGKDLELIKGPQSYVLVGYSCDCPLYLIWCTLTPLWLYRTNASRRQ